MTRRIKVGNWLGAAPVAGLAILMLTATSGLLSAEEVTVASVRAAAEGCIRRAFPGSCEVEISYDGEIALGDLAGKSLEIRPHLMRDSDSFGPLPVTLEFWKDGLKVGQKSVSARVRVFRDVVVTTRRLDHHVLIESEATKLERRDIRTLGDQCLASTTGVTGMRTRRMIPEGRVILVSDVEAVPLIDRGERVLAVTSLGGITVTVTATALEDGSEGQMILVKNDRSGKRLHGIVTAEGLVRVEIAGAQEVGG